MVHLCFCTAALAVETAAVDEDAVLVKYERLFNALDRELPKITPAEERWLREEGRAVFSGAAGEVRARRYYASSEHAVDEVRRWHTLASLALVQIREARAARQGAEETYYWTEFVWRLRRGASLEWAFEKLARDKLLITASLDASSGFVWYGQDGLALSLLWPEWSDDLWRSIVEPRLRRELLPH